MNTRWRLIATVLSVVCLSPAAFIGVQAGDKKPKKASAEEISKQWGYPYGRDSTVSGGSTASVENGNTQYNQLVFKVKGSYNDTFIKVAKFYFEKCGSPRMDYTKLVNLNKGESPDGGKFFITDLRIDPPREMDFFYDRSEYTVTVFVHARGKDEIEVRISVAVR